MTRREINRLSGIAPIVLSLVALGLAMLVVTTGWERHLKDEGAAAHLFQLMIAAEVPLVVLFLATADWRQARTVVTLLGCQAAALMLAFVPVAYFRL